jgi:hypothetical protein
LNPPVFIKVDQLAQGTLVGSEAVGGVEPAQPGATQRTAALSVQGEGIQERRPATHAEEFGDERLRIAQAFGTHWNSRDLSQRLGTDPAIVREEEGKKGVRG